MKITITPTGLSAFLLADDTIGAISGSSWPNGAGGTYKEGLNPDQQRTVQVTPLFRAAYAFIAPRYNLVPGLSFTVERQFISYDANLAFCTSHQDIIPAMGEIMQQDTGIGSLIRYSPNAVLKQAQCEEFNGVYSRWKYAFTLAGPWQSSP